MRKFFFLAAVALAALFSNVSSLDAAFRITLQSGTTTKYFYADDSTVAYSSPAVVVGNFSVSFDTVFTNNPGESDIGTLSQSLRIARVTAGTNNSFTAFAEVIQDVPGLTTGAITGPQITTLNSAQLLVFTLPAGDPLKLTSETGVSGGGSTNTGMAFTTSIANGPSGTSVDSLAATLTSSTASEDTRASTTFSNPGNQYTLQQRITLTGVNTSPRNLNIEGITTVSAVAPAPPGMVLALAGFPALVFGAWVRRRQARS